MNIRRRKFYRHLVRPLLLALQSPALTKPKAQLHLFPAQFGWSKARSMLADAAKENSRNLALMPKVAFAFRFRLGKRLPMLLKCLVKPLSHSKLVQMAKPSISFMSKMAPILTVNYIYRFLLTAKPAKPHSLHQPKAAWILRRLHMIRLN